MKIERFGDASIDSAMRKEQQKTNGERQVDIKQQTLNAVEEFSLNVSQKAENFLSANKASVEAQKRDGIASKRNGRHSGQHKREREERLHELGAQKDEGANTLLGKAGFYSCKKTERQFELKEDPSSALSLDAEQLEHNYETINKKLLHQVQAADRNYRAHNLDSKVQFQGEDTTFIA